MRSGSMRWGVAVFAAFLAQASGCSGKPAAAPAPSGDRLVDLRVAVAARPKDLGARRELAHLELAAGRPGAALRQLLVLERNGGLGGRERAALARLMEQRGRARLRLGDGAAIDDLDHARRLGARPPAALETEAVFAAMLAALRAGDREALAPLVARARRLAPDDVRLHVADPDRAPVAELGAAALWLWRGAARRAALDLLDRYGQRDGADRDVLTAWVAARGWWKGTGGGFDLLTRRRLVSAGVSLCPIAADPADPGCAGTLDRVASDPELSVAVWQRAEERGWPLAELAGLRPPRPPLSRDPATLRRWRAVLGAEPRLDAAAGRLLARWHLSVDDEPRTAARRPMALGSPRRVPAVPLGLAVPAGEPALAEMAIAFRRDPALADRLAAAWVDGAVALGERGPAVADQWLRLGDPARALAWREKIAAESPRHPPHLFALGQAAAAAGDPVRAQVHFIEAAARSGDAGRMDLHAAAVLLRAGAPIEALTAARRALGESAPGEEGPALDAAAAAAAAAGRHADASRSCAERLARIPERLRAAAAAAQPPADDAALEAAIARDPDDVPARAALLARLPPEDPRSAELAAELLLIGLSTQRGDPVPALEAFAAAAERMAAIELASAARAEARGHAAVRLAAARGCSRRTPGR